MERRLATKGVADFILRKTIIERFFFYICIYSVVMSYDIQIIFNRRSAEICSISFNNISSDDSDPYRLLMSRVTSSLANYEQSPTPC